MTSTTTATPRALALFAGVGSTAHALRTRGFEVTAIEREAAPVASLRANGIRAHQADVKAITMQGSWRQYGAVDVIVGGPPCQPFSQAADNAGRYDDRDCIPDFIAAVRTLRPRLFIMEEVQTLTWKRHADYLARVVADLEAAGYNVERRVLDMSDYGIPQARKRLFVIGTRADCPAPAWPAPHERKVTMAEALGWDAGTCARRNALAPSPAWAADARSHWPLSRPSTTVVGSFRPDVQAAPGYRRAGDGPRQNTPGSVVTTQAERMALQCIPADWKIEGTQAQVDLQIGNSCPWPMVAALLAANGA